MSDVVVTTNKSTCEETLACTQCAFLVKKGLHSLKFCLIFFVGSCRITFRFILVILYFGLYFSGLGALYTNTDQMNQPTSVTLQLLSFHSN